MPSLAPWLAVPDAGKAVAFYREAFEAAELYALDDNGRVVVARLGLGDAEWWVQEEPGVTPAEGPIRMILTVDDPDAVFAQALRAGAREVFPVGEGHGWRMGRLADVFGYHWEVGKPLT